MVTALVAFRRHLAAERGLSPHTVRAYLGDISALLRHAAEQAGCTSLADIDIAVLRGWLGSQHQAGLARTSLARRAAAARAFTAFSHERGWLAVDPGTQLGTPKVARHLPQVLAQNEVLAVLGGPHPGGDEVAEALALRDTAIMELLYATGIRVSELCGLDVGDLDTG